MYKASVFICFSSTHVYCLLSPYLIQMGKNKEIKIKFVAMM